VQLLSPRVGAAMTIKIAISLAENLTLIPINSQTVRKK
jgi:hypothetical protein